MPEYLAPGVFIEEFEIGAKPIEGVSTSTAAFLGETERGPTYPQLITSFPEYRRIFGGFFDENKFMPVSVDGFFANGGQRCFVVRIVDTASATASILQVGSITINTIGEGLWGTRVFFTIKPPSTQAGGFRLQVHYWSAAAAATLPNPPLDPTPTATDQVTAQTLAQLRTQAAPQISEDFDDLVLDPTSPNYVEK